MPARSIASATISFGLVSVPVNLFSSAESSATSGEFEIHLPDGEPGPLRLSASTRKPPRFAHVDDVTPGATGVVLRFDR